MDKILITGVAGFLGSKLAQKLLDDENVEIIGIDDFSSSDVSSLYPLLRNNRFNFFEHDLSNYFNEKVDYIYHLSGNGDFKNYFINKNDFIIKQIAITKNIIELSQKNGSKLVLTTSYLDYQEKNRGLFEYYDLLKLIQDLILYYVEKNELNAVFARLDYVYGGNYNKNDDRFIPKVIIDVIKNKKIEIDYDESFYFTYIDDVVLNLIKLMNNISNTSIVDLVNKSLYLKSDLIKLIINLSKSNSTLSIKSNETYHPSYKPTINDEYICNSQLLESVNTSINHFRMMYFN